MNSSIDYALAYAEAGLAVLPVHTIDASGICSCGNADCASPGKHPITAHGSKDASKDPVDIVQWWSDHPEANIAIATGEISGVFVIDVDTGEGKTGFASLETLEADIGPIPRDAVVRTGSGGLHIYLRVPDAIDVGNSASKIADNIDVRGNGGYVVAPPSRHYSGNNYTWEAPNAA